MEPKFDSKTYRENLAKDLKEIRKTDPRKAREVLDEEKYHFRYKSAASQRQAEKFEQEAEKLGSAGKLLNEAVSAVERGGMGGFLEDKGSRVKTIENFKKYLEQKNVPFNAEKSITKVFDDGKMEINGEIVDTNIFSANIPKYSYDRAVVITPKDLYIEIVPGYGKGARSYESRFQDIPELLGGHGISTIAMKDGFGIMVENVNLFSKDKNFTKEHLQEINDQIGKLLLERLIKKEEKEEKEEMMSTIWDNTDLKSFHKYAWKDKDGNILRGKESEQGLAKIFDDQ